MSVLDKVILGIQDGHDAAAAIVHNGRILSAISEERLQRIKSTGGFPAGAIEACLADAGLSKMDVDYVAVGGTRAVPVNMLGTMSSLSQRDMYRIQEELRRPYYYEQRSPSFSGLFPDYEPAGNVYYARDLVPLKETRELSESEKTALTDYRRQFIAEFMGLPTERIFLFDHHTCHAYYAYYASPFREGPVCALTMDAGGDGVYDSVNVFASDGAFTRLHASHDCIIGPLYTYVTLMLGMRPLQHEYKVMGLAPYAKEHVKRFSRETFLDYLQLDGIAFHRNPEVRDLFWHTKELLKHERFDGVAGGLQDFAEHFLVRWTRNAMAETGARNVTFSGGVSLNVKANKLLSEIDEINGLFVPPGAGDESLPIGAAWALMDHLNPRGDHRTSIEPLHDAYLGSDFDERDIDAFRAHPAVNNHFEEASGDVHRLVCEALIDGDVVAICRGRMEFGPRALGHRSLLADPRSRESVTKINEAVKGRDFWMPFAPSVLSEDIGHYFEGGANTALGYMTTCLDTTMAGRGDLPACLHPYDSTGRVHAVEASVCPDYHALISRFKIGRAHV